MSLPQHEEQEYQKGVGAFDEGRLAEALQLFSTLVQQFPHEAKIQFALGVTWDELGQREKAIHAIETAAGLSFDLPNNRNPYSEIANRVSLDAKNEERHIWLDRALEWAIASKSPLQIARAKYDLAAAAGNVEDSLRYVKEALTYSPNDTDLLTYLSNVLIERGDAEGSRKTLQDALDSNLFAFRIHYALALTYRALHQETEMMASLEKAVFGPDVILYQRTAYYRMAVSWLTRYYFRKRRFRDVMRISLQTVHLGDKLKREVKLAALK